MMLAMGLGNVVRDYRTKRKWSQGQLATYTGLSQGFISRLELGHYKTAEPPVLQKIADALGAPLAELLEAAGITDAPYRPVPPMPTPEERYPAPLKWLWDRMTDEERAEVEQHAQWVWERRSRRRAKKQPMPETEEAHDQG